MEILYNSAYLTISYDSDNNWIYADWKGVQTPDNIAKGGLAMIEITETVNKKKGCIKVLNDNTHVIGHWSTGKEFNDEEWFRMMKEAGMKFFAWVLSPNVLSKVSSQKMIHSSGREFDQNIRTFHNMAEAKKWLKLQ